VGRPGESKDPEVRILTRRPSVTDRSEDSEKEVFDGEDFS
jgi:hypothetical protein